MQRGITFILHRRKIKVFCRPEWLTYWGNSIWYLSVLKLNMRFFSAITFGPLHYKKKKFSVTPFHFPPIHSCNYFLTSPFSCCLSFSPQKGHISNMLCSFDADGRLKVSVFGFLLCCLVWCVEAFYITYASISMYEVY